MKSFDVTKTLTVNSKTFQYIDVTALPNEWAKKAKRLPYCHKVLLENVLRQDDGSSDIKTAIEGVLNWDAKAEPTTEIPFSPARVVLQDFTGVPAVVDLAVMRDACEKLGGDADQINPQLPVELVIDHSVQVDFFASDKAFALNVEREYERNRERYAFLRWGQKAFENFKVVPPGTGIVHQVNLEYLGQVAFSRNIDGKDWVYFDTLVGTDSHTTMINGLGILGWGVGGIEAEAAMLGQPISLLVPQVIGFELKGKLKEGATATDLVLTVTQMLREKGVVGKFVEFFGSGMKELSLADRATISNMAPEYGATCGLFPVDEKTIDYLTLSARSQDQIALVEAYSKAQGVFSTTEVATYSDTLSLELGDVEPSLAGPRRPQDKFFVKDAKDVFNREFQNRVKVADRSDKKIKKDVCVYETDTKIEDGDVVIAAITSCTNTSNPSVMLAAGLLAENALKKGLTRKPWVKSSLAPGSKVVTDYLNEAGLTKSLDALGFNLVGYGCTTCIGNSGPLPEVMTEIIQEEDLVVCSVLSGNRNFEGRIHQNVRFSFLASPPLVVVYALAGTLDKNIFDEALGQNASGDDIFLKDIWPSNQDIAKALEKSVKTEMFEKQYATVFDGDENWKSMPIPKGQQFTWEDSSTYIKAPTFFDGMNKTPDSIKQVIGMKCLVKVGDSITTDHISPAGAIAENSPAGVYLKNSGIDRKDFNSYGSRRGNHEVMTRGTFANVRLKNELAPGTEGGFTIHPETQDVSSIYDAAQAYAKTNTPLIVLAGKEYGTGSSRDWAAKGTTLLGIRMVVAESFERIHRSNLIGMGVLPLEFTGGDSAATLGLTGKETFDLADLNDDLKPGDNLTMKADDKEFAVKVRIDTQGELDYYRHGGILHFVLRNLVSGRP